MNTIKYNWINHGFRFLLIFSILTTLSFDSFCQDDTDTLNYCGFDVFAYEPCFAYHSNSIICGQQSIKWSYGERLPYMTELEYVQKLKETLTLGFKGEVKELKNCSSFGWPLDAIYVTYEYPGGYTYQILAVGEVNHYAVLIHCFLYVEPKSTESLPNFIRQFLTIK